MRRTNSSPKTLGTDWKKAVDTARPLFGYLSMNAEAPTVVLTVLIPVKDEPSFRKMIAGVVGKVAEGKDGVLSFEVPGERDAEGKPVSAFVRFANQHAYVTYKDAAAVALNRIPTPSQVVAGDPTAGISARLYMDRMPDVFRHQAIGGVQQFKATMNGGMTGGPGGPMWAMAFTQMVLFGGPMFQMLPLSEPAIRDGQELTLNVRYERARLNLSLDATLTAKSGSELSKLTAALKPATSLFPQMLGADWAARGLIRGTVPAELLKLIVPQMEAGIAQAPKEDAVWGAFAGTIGESLLPSLREGEMDLAGGLAGPGKEDRYGIVGGLRIKDAANVEKALRAAVKALPQAVQAMFKIDAATVGGVKVHQLLLPPLPEPAKSIFGESTVHIAFRPDAVIVAFGDGAPGAIEPALTAKPAQTKQTFVDASGRKLLPLVTKIDADVGKKFKAFLGTDIDRVPILEMAVEGGSALKVRYGNMLTSAFPLFGWIAFRGVPAVEMRQAKPVPIAVPAAPIK